jgi:hypothetical protein
MKPWIPNYLSKAMTPKALSTKVSPATVRWRGMRL